MKLAPAPAAAPAAAAAAGGSALTDVLIAAALLTSLLFVMPMLGGLVSARQQALGLARAQTWQATVDPAATARPDADAGEWMDQQTLTHTRIDVDLPRHHWMGDWLTDCSGSTGRFVCLSEEAAILAGGWSAADDEQAVTQIGEWVPASRFAPVGEVLSALGALPMFTDLRPLDESFGHIDMSVLPAEVKAPVAQGSAP